MHIHKKLIKLRNGKGISQERLAEAIGVSRQTITKWESGESLPDTEKAVLLSRYYGITLDSLLRDDEDCMQDALKPELSKFGIIEFLCEAKKRTYAGKSPEVAPSRTASHDLRFVEDDLAYHDTYLGGKRFSGEEAVWKNDIPIWAMNYSGRVLDESFSGDFLKEALLAVPCEMPFRGPSVYVKDEYRYHCIVHGDFEWFRGEEEILVRDKKVYECVFHGGTVE